MFPSQIVLVSANIGGTLTNSSFRPLLLTNILLLADRCPMMIYILIWIPYEGTL